MSATMKLPGIGNVKNTYVYAGVGITAGIVLFAYYRRSKASSAAPATTSVDAQATDPYSTDPTAAGYNTVYPSGYSGQSPYGYDYLGNPNPAPTGLGSGGAYQTNNDWATAGQDALVAAGIAREVSGLAIAHVLGGLTVTSTQQGYFLQAVGLLGQPPQGYPKPIKVQDPPVHTPPPGHKPPPTHGGTPHTPSGLKATRVDRTGISLAWNAVAGAKGYTVYLDGKQLQTVLYTNEYVHDLKPNTTHTLAVAALGTNGKFSGKTTIHVKTHK